MSQDALNLWRRKDISFEIFNLTKDTKTVGKSLKFAKKLIQM